MSRRGGRGRRNDEYRPAAHMQEVSGFVDQAIHVGIANFVRTHPRFGESPQYVARHVDKEKVMQEYTTIVADIRAQMPNIDRDTLHRMVYHQLANQVAQGQEFDAVGQRVVMKAGLAGRLDEPGIVGGIKRLFGRMSGRDWGRDQVSLDRTVAAAIELKDLMASGDYAQHMPELNEAITEVYRAGFLQPALDTLREYDLLNDRSYNFIKTNILKKIKSGKDEMVSAVAKYSAPRNPYAASILGIAGLAVLILTATGITGNVIGSAAAGIMNVNVAGIALGVLLMALAGLVVVKREKNNRL